MFEGERILWEKLEKASNLVVISLSIFILFSPCRVIMEVCNKKEDMS